MICKVKNVISAAKAGKDNVKQAIVNKDFTTREAVLFSVCLFLLGIVIGMILSPKGNRMAGCYNSNAEGCGCCGCCGDEDFE